MLTPTLTGSDEVRGELRTAIDEGKPIVPILYQPCRISRRLKLYQFVDFTSGDIKDESKWMLLLDALRAQNLEIQKHQKKPNRLSTPPPLDELASIADEWAQNDYPGYIVEGLSEKQKAFVRHPPKRLNISDPDTIMFLIRASLHYGGNWPFWIAKCEESPDLIELLLNALCQSYDRVRFRALYALQYVSIDQLKVLLAKRKNEISDDLMSIAIPHVYSHTVLAYLKRVASSSDKPLASKASAIIKEISQFGSILQK